MTEQEILILINEAEKDSKHITLSGLHKRMIVQRLFPVIQSAILAEREACAKIAEKVSNESEICAKRSTGMREKRLFTGGKIACDSVVSKIRARSNAPESPNKPLEQGFDDQRAVEREIYLKICT